MKDRDWRIFKEDFNISCKGGSIPNPLRYWSEANINPKIASIIDKIGYKQPTPIQRQTIPLSLINRDIIGVAQTGSGKTASFLIPILDSILKLPPLTHETVTLGPHALILAPTRELAQQIEQEALKFCIPLGLVVVSIVGGHAIQEQAFNLRDGSHIIIATPGRLKDVIDRHIVVLNQCIHVVLDEADKMIDMGFEVDVNCILDSIGVKMKPKDSNIQGIYRQTVMFSATMPISIERLANKYLVKQATVYIGSGQVVDEIEQRVEMISNETQKRNRLFEILKSAEFKPPMIVFVNSKKSCDALSKSMNNLGLNTTILHGGKSQDQRESSLEGLKTGRFDVLVATDVAGRGLDIDNVSLVLNYEMANTIEAWTHRIGRTGRAGKKGVAITFLTNEDSEVFFDLRVLLVKSNARMPSEFSNHPAAIRRVGEKRKERDITG